MQIRPSEPVILTVSELNQYARGVLEKHIGPIKVLGEISNLARVQSGHWYFTLKDTQAQIRCAMFRHRNQLLRQPIENGMQVIVQGSPSLYEPRGDYQMIVDFLEDAGLGALQRRFDELKQKLANEGLFSQAHKKPLPPKIRHIAVITSATGAVIHDILHVLNKRYPLMRITLIRSNVQGEKAVDELCSALNKAQLWNQHAPQHAFDAVIIGRGGGSLEDLWAFNEEKLARAIFACSIPVISAVGHETDVTISDFVADFRAPTPSAAAEMISPDIQTLQQNLDRYALALERNITQRVNYQRQHILQLQRLLKHPKQTLQHKQQQVHFLQSKVMQHTSARIAQAQQQVHWLNRQLLSHAQSKQIIEQQRYLLLLQEKLSRVYTEQTTRYKHRLQELQQRLAYYAPTKNIAAQQQTLQRLSVQLHKAQQHLRLQKRQQLQNQMQLLHIVSPLATLTRGYSITTQENGTIVRDHSQVKLGDTLHTRLKESTLISTITAIKDTSHA